MTELLQRQMNSALDISKYIICIAQNNGDPITNLKLQKLLYYAQAWYLVNNNNNRLFDEPILAWPYGPVVKSVYDEFKSFGRMPININCDFDNDFQHLCENDRRFLNEFCQAFLRFSATELVAMTHQEKPWVEAINKGVNTPIDTNTMYNFYSEMLRNG